MERSEENREKLARHIHLILKDNTSDLVRDLLMVGLDAPPDEIKKVTLRNAVDFDKLSDGDKQYRRSLADTIFCLLEK